MPGDEFEEKTHNFFGQEGLSQDQHQPQVVDGSWSGFSNGLLSNQKQRDPSFIANLKSCNTQQSVDPQRSQSNSHHGLNVNQQPVRSESSGSFLQEHQQLTNGCMHGNLGLQTMPNGTNFLGMDVESSRDRLSELHKIPTRFGGQQQLTTQLPGVLHPLPRGQMTFNDMQLLNQQDMAKQIHEYQMQQQLQKQQLEDASSNCWQADLMTGNTNWMHRGISQAIQSSSSGLMISPEHGHANFLAQQFEPSLYGTPVSDTNTPQNAFPSVQMNRLDAQRGSVNMCSSLTKQATSFVNQGDVQDSNILPRSTYPEKVLFSDASVHGTNNRSTFENFQQDDSQQRNISVQEKFSQMEGSGRSEKSFMEVPENINALQMSSTLDPTEEKILFGSDDHLWEACGNSTDMSLTGNLMSSNSDIFDECPSLQSGSWSALMRSVVAETYSDDAGVHAWTNNNTGPHTNSHTGSQDLGVKASNALSETLHSDSTGAAAQHFPGKENKISDHGLLEKPMAQLSQMAGNIFHSSCSGIDEQKNSRSIQKNEDVEDRFGIWKAVSNQNLAAQVEQKKHSTLNSQIQRSSYRFGVAGDGNNYIASRDVQGNIPQQKSRDSSQILESYNNAGSNGMVNACDFSMFPGGKDEQSGHVGSRLSASRKFQYHPMGNIDVSSESCHEKVSHFPPTLDQVSVGNQRYLGQSNSLGQSAMNVRIDRGHVSQNELNCTNETYDGMGSDNSPSTSVSVGVSVDRCKQVKSISSRQTMLELLHKVDQSPENSSETNVPGIPEANTYADYGGQFQLQHIQTSASQGFNLQLAPPSQLAPSPQNLQFSHNSQPLFASSSPQQNSSSGMISDSQARISASQRQFWNQPSKPQPDILRPHPFQTNKIANSFARQEKTNQSSSQMGGSVSLSGGDMVNMHELQSKDMGAKQTSDVASMFSKMVQSNHQSSDRSLPSKNLPKDSLCHNEQMAGSEQGDAPKITVNRVEKSSIDPQKVASKGEQQSPSRSDDLIRDGLNRTTNHMPHFGLTVSQNLSSKNHPASAGAYYQQISPQMAPSWYSQYGTFKHGLVQPVNDTGRFTPSKIGEHSSNVESSVDITPSVQSSEQLNKQQMPGSVPGVETPSSKSLLHGAMDKLLKDDKSKKRKTTTSELLSSNKEVVQDRQRLKTLSEAEVKWAAATKRLPEKMEFATLLEDGPPIRSKRRLIYTTQLMQQLFSPPPGRVISLVASSNFEFVVYTAARAALEDACSSGCTEQSELFFPWKDSSLLCEATKTEKTSDQYISKPAEDFVSRTQKLENEFVGLENGTKIPDLRVEVEDVEKYAVINRFAKFHPPSSSMERTMNSQWLKPQRYVTIAPMPQNIPDRVQCLSL